MGGGASLEEHHDTAFLFIARGITNFEEDGKSIDDERGSLSKFIKWKMRKCPVHDFLCLELELPVEEMIKRVNERVATISSWGKIKSVHTFFFNTRLAFDDMKKLLAAFPNSSMMNPHFASKTLEHFLEKGHRPVLEKSSNQKQTGPDLQIQQSSGILLKVGG